jgi:hypothetical protein
LNNTLKKRGYQMKRQRWFLHTKEWQEKGTMKEGVDFFVVCPNIEISIELECNVGYLSKFKKVEDALPTALREAKRVATEFERCPILKPSVSNRVIGKKIYLDPVRQISTM